MRSAISVEIDAPGELVYRLASDVTRWPALLPHYRDVGVLAAHDDGSITARMLAVRTLVPAVGYGIPVAWRARAWRDPATRGLRFRHLGGATGGMDVTWSIEPADAGCRVTIEHVFEPRLPGWARFLDRLFVRQIASRTLATFKAIAESADAATSQARSTRRRTAKKSA